MPKVNSSPHQTGRVLLTRPAHKNLALAQLLAAQGFDSLSYPLITLTSLTDDGLADKLAQSDIVIAVSANAIVSADQQIKRWPNKCYFAVGSATAQAFLNIDVEAIAPDDPRTEGLLALTSLRHLSGKNILILRGNGGRETLAQQLSARGAVVTYSELYCREPVLYAKNVVEQWQRQGITTIVVTSVQILQKLLELVNNGYRSWLDDILVIVPSPRVAQVANQLGVTQVITAAGADNQAILAQLINLQSSFYEK